MKDLLWKMNFLKNHFGIANLTQIIPLLICINHIILTFNEFIFAKKVGIMWQNNILNYYFAKN